MDHMPGGELVAQGGSPAPPREEPSPPLLEGGGGGVLARATFSWVSPLLRRGACASHLLASDLVELPPGAHPDAAAALLWGQWVQFRQ